jgi:histidinol phosphatase-like enzyme
MKRAARDLNIDLKNSFMIGDQHRDVLMARNAGVKGILVLTGAGRSCREKAKNDAVKISRNLTDAAKWISRQ